MLRYSSPHQELGSLIAEVVTVVVEQVIPVTSEPVIPLGVEIVIEHLFTDLSGP